MVESEGNYPRVPFGKEYTVELMDQDEPKTYVLLDQEGQRLLRLGIGPEAFSISWATQLSSQEFINVVLEMSNALSTLAPSLPLQAQRETPKVLDIEDSDVSIVIDNMPGYTRDGVNNILADGFEDYLGLDKFSSPPQVSELTALNGLDYEEENTYFIRVNMPYFRALFHEEVQMAHSFTFWSHVYEPKSLVALFQKTSSGSVSPETFQAFLQQYLYTFVSERYARVDTAGFS